MKRRGLLIILSSPSGAGKSTLMNRFVAEKVAIVSDKPQTTRSRIVGILSEERGQIVFLDTPGVLYSRLEPEQTARMSVFHYLVANTDWSLSDDSFTPHMKKWSTGPKAVALVFSETKRSPATRTSSFDERSSSTRYASIGVP